MYKVSNISLASVGYFWKEQQHTSQYLLPLRSSLCVYRTLTDNKNDPPKIIQTGTSFEGAQKEIQPLSSIPVQYWFGLS